MPRVAPLLAVLAALLTVLPSGTAISCYKCSDLLDVDTGDSTAGDLIGGLLKSFGGLVGLPPCTEFQPNEARFRHEDCLIGSRCVKMVLRNGKTSRSCSPLPQDGGCTETDGGDVACSCSTDYCNSAGRSAPTLPLLLLLLLPAALLALLTNQL